MKYVVWAYGRKEGCCVWFQKHNRAKRIVSKHKKVMSFQKKKSFVWLPKFNREKALLLNKRRGVLFGLENIKIG